MASFGQSGYPVGEVAAITVQVNGVLATVEEGNFSAPVPLQHGANTITALARDVAGHEGSASSTVYLED